MLCYGAVTRCVSYDAHLATAPQHIPTQHDMLPQHLVCKYELNCEHCNITLARNKAPWWWSDKIETCASYDAHLATAPQHIPTQHYMLPQHLVCKYELNCEHCNITLARNKAPWWWSDKIETCRSVLKCFKVFYGKLYVLSLVDKLKWFYKNARCYNNICSCLPSPRWRQTLPEISFILRFICNVCFLKFLLHVLPRSFFYVSPSTFWFSKSFCAFKCYNYRPTFLCVFLVSLTVQRVTFNSPYLMWVNLLWIYYMKIIPHYWTV